jgi:hypothetical protein
VERRAHAELDASELEEVSPHMAGEHLVSIADDRLEEAM